jgi:hypothetical protein
MENTSIVIKEGRINAQQTKNNRCPLQCRVRKDICALVS